MTITSLPVPSANRAVVAVAAAFLACSLAGCSAKVDALKSRTGTDPIAPFDHMLVVSAVNDHGTSPDFPTMIGQAFQNAGALCGIKVDFIYESIDKQKVGPRYAAQSGIELSVVPRVIFDEKMGSYKYDSAYGYVASLTDWNTGLEHWRSTFSFRPVVVWSSQGSAELAKDVADRLFAQMKQDGVLVGCSPAAGAQRASK